MELWFIILISISIAALLKTSINLLFPSKTQKHTYNLPPGPVTFPVISNLQWFLKSFSEVESTLKNLHAKFGPMVTLHIGAHPTVFIDDRSLAHKALVENGAIFADRPNLLPNYAITSRHHNINTSNYGHTWRLFRRNLTVEFLHPARVKSYEHARKWVLQILLDRFKSEAKDGDPVTLIGHIRYAMFSLSVLMCFGDKLDENTIKEVERVVRGAMSTLGKFNVLTSWPSWTRIVFRKWWRELLMARKEQKEVLVELVRARKKMREERAGKEDQKDYVLCYLDTLLDMELPEEKRKLTEEEVVSLSSEFLIGGTDSTSAGLQWIMANVVKFPDIQQKLFTEIKGVIGQKEQVVKGVDLRKMPYVKAVVLEGLRRHSPSPFVMPHAATEDVVLDKYVIPKNGIVNVLLTDLGLDPKVWEDPMAFKPERFLNDGSDHNVDGGRSVEAIFDLRASQEIKMMPFGAGKRICPGLHLAVFHLQYFLANLVLSFEWKKADGREIELSEKPVFATALMKNPLQAHISPRIG